MNGKRVTNAPMIRTAERTLQWCLAVRSYVGCLKQREDETYSIFCADGSQSDARLAEQGGSEKARRSPLSSLYHDAKGKCEATQNRLSSDMMASKIEYAS